MIGRKNIKLLELENKQIYVALRAVRRTLTLWQMMGYLTRYRTTQEKRDRGYEHHSTYFAIRV